MEDTEVEPLHYPEHQAPLDTGMIYQGPSLYPLTGQDFLQVGIAGAVAGATVTVCARTLNQRGVPQRHVRTFTPSSNRTFVGSVVNIGDGFLLDVSARVTGGSVIDGQVWVVLELVIGQIGEQQKVTTLAAGYVTPTSPVFGPASQYASSLDTAGAPRSIQVGNPAAGADWSLSVPAGARWDLISASALFTSSVGVATRLPRLIVDDGTNTLFEAPAIFPQAASLAITQSWGAGAGGPVTTDELTGGSVSSGLPNDFMLLAGWRVRSSTGAIQVGDQWSAISVSVLEWLEQ